jgi:hypothetical protein
MWTQKGNSAEQLDRPEMLQLFEYHQRAEWNALDKYVQHLNIQLALMTALLTGGIIAIISPWTTGKFVVLFVPLVMVCLRKFTIESLDRSYRRFLEAAAGSRKLEWLLQFDRPISVSKGASERETVFPDDKCLDVARRWGGLPHESRTSAAWVTDHMGKGRNDVAWRLLRFIFITTLLIPPAFWLVAAATEASWDFSKKWLIAMGSLVVIVEVVALTLYCTHSRKIVRDRQNGQNIRTHGSDTREHSDA